MTETETDTLATDEVTPEGCQDGAPEKKGL